MTRIIDFGTKSIDFGPIGTAQGPFVFCVVSRLEWTKAAFDVCSKAEKVCSDNTKALNEARCLSVRSVVFSESVAKAPAPSRAGRYAPAFPHACSTPGCRRLRPA